MIIEEQYTPENTHTHKHIPTNFTQTKKSDIYGLLSWNRDLFTGVANSLSHTHTHTLIFTQKSIPIKLSYLNVFIDKMEANAIETKLANR